MQEELNQEYTEPPPVPTQPERALGQSVLHSRLLHVYAVLAGLFLAILLTLTFVPSLSGYIPFFICNLPLTALSIGSALAIGLAAVVVTWACRRVVILVRRIPLRASTILPAYYTAAVAGGLALSPLVIARIFVFYGPSYLWPLANHLIYIRITMGLSGLLTAFLIYRGALYARGAVAWFHAEHTGWRTYLRIMAYARPYGRHIVFAMCFMVLYAGVSLLPALAIKYIVDLLTEAGKLPINTFVIRLATGLGMLAAAWTGYQVFNYFGRLTLRYVGGKVVHDLRTATHRYLQTLSLDFFDSRRSGEIMSRLTSDVDQVEILVNNVIDNILINSIQTVAVLGLLFYTDWGFALWVLVPVPIMIFLIKKFGRRAGIIFKGARKSFGTMCAKLQDNLGGIRVVKTFNEEIHEANRFAASSERYRKRMFDGYHISMQFGVKISAAVYLSCIIALSVGGLAVAQGRMTLGTLMMFYFGLLQGYLYANFNSLANLADPILRALTSANRVFAILDTQSSVNDAPDAIVCPTLTGNVEFRNVSFRYGEGGNVLTDVNIVAPAGIRVALVGKSGAGKTSFVNMIPRFYDPIEGQILVDGVDVRAYKQETLRKQMAMVLQDVYLFNGTVKENMLYGNQHATMEQVEAAARAANAHEFIDQLPDRYDTIVGERGVKLSGGQKQRLSIARAILADPKILILDEATSSVDSESEILIHEAMDRLMQGRTTFIIAHRLSTVRDADLIIGLEQGRIREVGNHEQLVAIDNGVYRQLYELQQRADARLTGAGRR